jgi:hypothetical protein
MADREKYSILWPCVGGAKRTTVKGKPGNVFGGTLTTLMQSLSGPFSAVPGSDGTAVMQVNTVKQTSCTADGSSTKPDKSAATVCTFRDDNGDTHTYRFPEGLAANYSDDGKGNKTLTQAAGDALATELSSLTGYTMSFVYGWLDRAKQNS